MNAASITSSTFTLSGPSGAAVAGTVTYSNSVATFTPSALLAYSTTYTATISAAAAAPGGASLISNYVWTFTTITPVPAVISTAPANLAVNVPVGQVLTATFNQAMTASTINATTFTVSVTGGAAVAGAVTYSGTTATFAPTVSLASNTQYTATVTTGAKSLAGTPLAANYVWSFTTISPPPVVIATVPLNAATGVPVNQVLTATFNQAMNCSTYPASAFVVAGPGATSVPGTISCTGSVVTFTPAANLAYNTVFTATITTGAQNLAGTPLASNYVWTFQTVTAPPAPTVIATVPANTATGVPVNQVLTATFSQTMNCSAYPAAAFVVAGPGATSVPGTIACSGAVVTFTPAANLAYNTVFTATITTGAKNLAGTPLASNYVWTFRTLPAPTPPVVIATVPVNGAVSVPINQAISATFSEAMISSTINATTFTLTATGGASVSGVVSYVAAGSIATFTPAASLAPTTQYTATVTTGAQDLAGIGLASNYAWTFTTAALPTAIPPTVVSTIPAGLATGVPFNQIVSATFSTAMDPATINATTFSLTGPGATAISGLVAYASVGNTLTFTPTSNLAPNTTFTATITTGAKNLAGTALANNYVWTFTTGATPAIILPVIVSTVPLNSATNVPLSQAVSATFSKAMNPLTLTTATFTLEGPGGAAIVATVSYDAVNFIATLTPTAALSPITTYVATITTGATDLANNPLGNTGAQNPWSFTTATSPVTPPVVLGPTIVLFGGFGGGAGMTNQGINTVINGSIGTTAASSLMTGFHDTSVMVSGIPQCVYTETTLNKGLVMGTINTAAGSSQPTASCPDEGTAATFAIASNAALEALTAYNTLTAIPGGLDVSVCPGCGGGSAGELGNRTLAPGTYKSAPGSYAITAGDLTLDAQGDPNVYWVFQMASSLTVGTPTSSQSVLLVNGAKASNVYWVVGGLPGAVINYGGGGTMSGTVISSPGITVSSPGQSTSPVLTIINGRVLALNASVTIVNTVINVPAP